MTSRYRVLDGSVVVLDDDGVDDDVEELALGLEGTGEASLDLLDGLEADVGGLTGLTEGGVLGIVLLEGGEDSVLFLLVVVREPLERQTSRYQVDEEGGDLGVGDLRHGCLFCLFVCLLRKHKIELGSEMSLNRLFGVFFIYCE